MASSTEGYASFTLAGVDAVQTQRIVEELAEWYGNSPLMRLATVDLVLRPAGIHERDKVGAVAAVYRFVRDEVRFTEEAGEQVLSPGRTLAWRYGDCDDKTALVCAMLESIRVRWKTALLGRLAGDGFRPFHILPYAFVQGVWVPLEVSDRRARPGEDPRDLMRRVSVQL